MIDKKQKMIDAFIEKDDILEKESALIRRANEAEEKIVELQEEAETLKKKRPQLLADCKDISKLNHRLKAIEEEIEILKDTIIGVNEKQENLLILIKLDQLYLFGLFAYLNNLMRLKINHFVMIHLQLMQ